MMSAHARTGAAALFAAAFLAALAVAPRTVVAGGTGACCLESGCRELTPEDCDAHGGVFQGFGVPCEPDPCGPPTPTGACCLSGGGCLVEDSATCLSQGGSYQGDGTVCDPSPCPPPPPPSEGACCLSDGRCVVLDPGSCEEHGGTYLGDGVECNAGLCSATPGEQPTWGRVKHLYR